MLGKTNISTVEKGVIISDIEDYRWDSANIQGINETLIKVIYANNILVGITETGTIAYTKDGENWECKTLELENGDCLELADIAYGKGKYVIVGSHKGKETSIHGLIVVTEDFVDYDIKTEAEQAEYFNPVGMCIAAKFFAVSSNGNNFIILYTAGISLGASRVPVYSAVTDMDKTVNNLIDSGISNLQSNMVESAVANTICKSAKKVNGEILYYQSTTVSSGNTYETYNEVHHVQSDGIGQTTIVTDGEYDYQDTNLYSIFECKDALYYAANTNSMQYKVQKVIGSGDTEMKSSGIAYGFVDAVYFDKCEVFINDHEMLVVKRGENLADKSLNDMVEITYDFSMTSIIKAFNKLYIFGTGGSILVSSAESRNEDVLSIKTMSAVKALYEAKVYTDNKCKEIQMENLDEYVKKEDLEELGERVEVIWNDVFNNNEGEESGEGDEA